MGYRIECGPEDSLQQAVDNLPDDGQEALVLLREGIYPQRLTVRRRNTCIQGSGKDRTVLTGFLAAKEILQDGFKRGTFRTYTVMTDADRVVLRDLTIENTAPATGDLLHRPGVSRTGLGIYHNAEEIEDYHWNRNLKNVPDFDTFTKIKYAQIGGRDEPYPKLTMPPKASYNRYYELHTGSAAADIPDEKLPEYAAKATAALFFRTDEEREFQGGDQSDGEGAASGYSRLRRPRCPGEDGGGRL